MVAVLDRGILLETCDGHLQADSNEHAEWCLSYRNKYCSRKHLLFTSLLYLVVRADFIVAAHVNQIAYAYPEVV